MMSSRGIDPKRVIIAEPDTIQKFRTHALKVIESYEKAPKDTRPPMLMVLDSLGLLSTSKEVEDSTEGKDVRDMTKSQLIKGAFRVLTLRVRSINTKSIVTFVGHCFDDRCTSTSKIQVVNIDLVETIYKIITTVVIMSTTFGNRII